MVRLETSESIKAKGINKIKLGILQLGPSTVILGIEAYRVFLNPNFIFQGTGLLDIAVALVSLTTMVNGGADIVVGNTDIKIANIIQSLEGEAHNPQLQS